MKSIRSACLLFIYEAFLFVLMVLFPTIGIAAVLDSTLDTYSSAQMSPEELKVRDDAFLAAYKVNFPAATEGDAIEDLQIIRNLQAPLKELIDVQNAAPLLVSFSKEAPTQVIRMSQPLVGRSQEIANRAAILNARVGDVAEAMFELMKKLDPMVKMQTRENDDGDPVYSIGLFSGISNSENANDAEVSGEGLSHVKINLRGLQGRLRRHSHLIYAAISYGAYFSRTIDEWLSWHPLGLSGPEFNNIYNGWIGQWPLPMSFVEPKRILQTLKEATAKLIDLDLIPFSNIYFARNIDDNAGVDQSIAIQDLLVPETFLLGSIVRYTIAKMNCC